MLHRLMRFMGTLAILALVPGGLPPLQGQEAESALNQGIVAGSRTLTIYKAECPPGYMGDASADECDANPVPGVPFRIGRPFTDAFYENVSTDAEGLVAFEFDGLPLDGTLRVIEELPANTAHFVVYCVDDSGDALDITYGDYAESNPDLGVVDIAVGEAGDVACDWYNVPATATADESQAAVVGLVGEPRWWIVPFAPGWGTPEKGRVYLGVLVENPTDATVLVGVNFRAYEADGTPFPEFHVSSSELPDASVSIAPDETAMIRVSLTNAPATLAGLQVTARLVDVVPLPDSDAPIDVLEVGFDSVEELSSPMETTYAPFALVQATGLGDVEAGFLFRFYDDQSVQVGTCESYPVTVEPEIGQRVECSSPLLLDTGSQQPVSVSVEPLSSRD